MDYVTIISDAIAKLFSSFDYNAIADAFNKFDFNSLAQTVVKLIKSAFDLSIG